MCWNALSAIVVHPRISTKTKFRTITSWKSTLNILSGKSNSWNTLSLYRWKCIYDMAELNFGFGMYFCLEKVV